MSQALRPDPVTTPDEARRVIVALCQLFYEKGWVSGTGGGISVRLGDKVYMAPSGIQKEMIQSEWIYELNLDGDVLQGPPSALGFNVSQCRPLFLEAMKLRGAGAVIHSHSKSAVLAAARAERDGARHIELTQLEMLKGLKGVGFDDVHRVPVIANTAQECDLAESLRAAIVDNPGVHAVVVKRHGMYVWGDDWLTAKRHAECYDELFSQAAALADLGVPLSRAPARGPSRVGGGAGATKEPGRACTFCGAHQRSVRMIFANASACICDACIRLCNDIIAKEAASADESG